MKICIWSPEENGYNNTYETECGKFFNINDDSTPSKLGMKYCPYCGKAISE